MELLSLVIGIGEPDKKDISEKESEKLWTRVPMWGVADFTVSRMLKEGGRLDVIKKRSE